MKFAPILGSNLTGRLGGIVASHNSAGTYFRRYVIPVNPNTSGQQAQRNAFATVSQNWRRLNNTQQQAWVSAGPQHVVPNSTGGSLQLTGQQLFMRMNTLRQRLGLALVTEAPTTDEVPTISTPTVVVHLNGDLEINFETDDEWNATGGGILVSASPLLSAGRNFNNQFLATGPQSGFAGPVSNPADVILPYSTVAGGRITLRFSAVTPDGRLSDYLYVDVDSPTQALITSFDVLSATSATVTFSRAITAADFATADFTGAWQSTVTILANSGDNVLAITGTGFASGLAYSVVPSGVAADYVPAQSGLTT